MISKYSSCVFDYEYESSPETALGTLDIRFRERGAYRYYQVPEDVIEDWESAGSLGQYFNEFIRNNYSYDRIG
jgi:hypothetical protein